MVNLSGWTSMLIALRSAGGLVALLIALGTASYQAIRAATANPVKNLRTE
jgi:hypothetical protein